MGREVYKQKQELKAKHLMGNQKLFQSPNAALGFGGLANPAPQYGMPHVPAWQQEQNLRELKGAGGIEDEGEDPFLQTSANKN